MTETTMTYDPLGAAIGRAGRELAELARRRLARAIRISHPTAAALEIEPIDTGGHAVLRVLDERGAALTTSDEDDLDWGSETMSDLATVERYSVRPGQDGPLTITLGPVPGAAGNETNQARTVAVLLEAAREAAAWHEDGSFSPRDVEMEAVLSQMKRGHAWGRAKLRELAEAGALVALDDGRYRLVSAIHRIISGDAYYGGGTDLDEVKERAAQMFRTASWGGDVFGLEWQRRGEDWSLVASHDDEEPDEQGMVPAWHTGVRIETVDVDAEDGALDLVIDDDDPHEFKVTVTAQDGTTTVYPAEGQAGAEAALALAARTGAAGVAILVDEDETGKPVAEPVRASSEPASAQEHAVWWLKGDDVFEYADPEVFCSEPAAQDAAVRVYREANDLTDDFLGWLGKQLPAFAWRAHEDGGAELHVDGRATGLIVRRLAVQDAPKAVGFDG